MQQTNTEIFWLMLTIMMTALFWVPYIINRMREQGPWPALRNPQPDTQPEAAWAKRMMKAHENAIENIAIFAPLVIIIEVQNIHSELTATLCAVYFVSRLSHFILYVMKVPFLRTVAFFIGFLCQFSLGITILNAV